jgi:hypothetical protein
MAYYDDIGDGIQSLRCVGNGSPLWLQLGTVWNLSLFLPVRSSVEQDV